MTNISIKTKDGVWIRSLHLNDAHKLWEFIQRDYPRLSRWVSFMDGINDHAEAFRLLRMILNIKSIVTLGIYVDDRQEQLIGLLQLHEFKTGTKKAELAYMLSEDHQGRGIMNSAINALLGYMFKNNYLNRVYVRVARENAPGRRMAVNLNFKFEGIERDGDILRGKYYDMEVYSLLKREYDKPDYEGFCTHVDEWGEQGIPYGTKDLIKLARKYRTDVPQLVGKKLLFKDGHEHR